jgi:ATP-binding cassette ChvD family protein
MVGDKKIIFSMVNVSKIYPPQKQVLKNIYLSFFYGAKIGVLGLNGTGKSSLLKIIAGLDKSFQGEVVFSPGYTVGYLAQEPEMDDSLTVIDVVKQGVQKIVDILAEYDAVNMKFMEEMTDDEMNKLIERQGELTERIDQHDAWELDNKLERAMDALRCPEPDTPIKNLSGGERRRVALCRLLLSEPDILLLDEPTNHLDAESVEWLEMHLQQYKGTVIAVTHDRYFLDNVAGWILELDRGEGIPWQGNYSSWLEQKTQRLAQEEKQESKRMKTLERELEWVRMSPKARQSKGKARLNAYDRLLNEDVKEREEKLQIYIPNGPRLGANVIDAVKVSKAFGDKLLFDDLNFSLPPNGIVGIIGPNGAGKTTLFRLIMGMEKADTGEFKIGETVKVGYIDQQHVEIDPEKTVWEVVSEGNEQMMMGGRFMNSRAYISRFNFGGQDQNKKSGVLSGGERNRLHLALTLKSEANVLLLDEPTNDIDINTLRALEEGLENFAGCAVIISHDRWFLDRVCTHILAFEGNSQIYFFEGNYTDYEENKKKRLGYIEPKRIRYKKLVK